MSGLHDAEQVLGRIRRDGGWDRRYTAARTRLDPWPEPRQRHQEPEEPFWQTLGVALLLVAALYLMVAVAAAANQPPPAEAAPIVQPDGLIR